MQLVSAPEAEAPWMTSERWISSTSPTSATLAGSQLALLALLPCLPSRAAYTWECRDDSTADQHVFFFSLLPFLFRYPLGPSASPMKVAQKGYPTSCHQYVPIFHGPAGMQLQCATYARCELRRSGQIPKDYIMTMYNQKKFTEWSKKHVACS